MEVKLRILSMEPLHGYIHPCVEFEVEQIEKSNDDVSSEECNLVIKSVVYPASMLDDNIEKAFTESALWVIDTDDYNSSIEMDNEGAFIKLTHDDLFELVDLSTLEIEKNNENLDYIDNFLSGFFEDRKFDEEYAEVLYQRIIAEFEKYLKKNNMPEDNQDIISYFEKMLEKDDTFFSELFDKEDFKGYKIKDLPESYQDDFDDFKMGLEARLRIKRKIGHNLDEN